MDKNEERRAMAPGINERLMDIPIIWMKSLITINGGFAITTMASMAAWLKFVKDPENAVGLFGFAVFVSSLGVFAATLAMAFSYFTNYYAINTFTEDEGSRTYVWGERLYCFFWVCTLISGGFSSAAFVWAVWSIKNAFIG